MGASLLALAKSTYYHCIAALYINTAVSFKSSITKIIIADLPTSITCKSGGFEKMSGKTWRLGPLTRRFPKCASN